MGYDLAPIVGKKAAAIGWDMLGEFGEEAYQYVTAEESKYLVQRILNPELDSSFDERMQQYVRDGEFWTSGFFGALGAGAMQTAGRAINDAIAGKGNSENARRLKNINDFGPMIKYWASEVRRAEDLGDVDAKAEAEDVMTSILGSKSVQVGGLNETIDMVETMYKEGGPTQEDLELIGIDEEDAKTMREKFPNIATKLQRVGELYDYHIKNFDSDLAAAMAIGEFQREGLYRSVENLKSQVAEQSHKVVHYDNLSLAGQQIFDANIDIKAYQKRIDGLKRRLLSDPNLKANPLARSDVAAQLESSETALNELIADKDNAVQNRSAEDKANDSKYESQMTPELQEAVGKLNSLKTKLAYSELATQSVQQQMDQLRQEQKERAKRPKKEPEVTPTPAPETTVEEEPVVATEDREKEASQRKKERESEIKETTGKQGVAPERLVDNDSKDYTVNQLLHAGGASYVGFLNGEQGVFSFEGGQFIFKDSKNNNIRVLETDELSGKSLGSFGAVLAKHSVFNTDMNVTSGVFTLTIGSHTYYTLPLDNPISAIGYDKDGNEASITVYLKDGKTPVTFTAPPLVHEFAYGVRLFEETKEKILSDFFKLDDNKGVRILDIGSEHGKEYEVYNKDGRWVVVDPESGKTIRKDSKVAARVIGGFNEDMWAINMYKISKVGQITNKEDEKNEIYGLVKYLKPPTPEQTNRSADVSTIQDPKGDTGEEGIPTAESTERGDKAEDSIVNEYAKDRADEEVTTEMAKEDAERQPESLQGSSTSVEPLSDEEIPTEHKAKASRMIMGKPDSVVGVWVPDKPSSEEMNKILSNPASNIKGFTAEIDASGAKEGMSDEAIGQLDMQITLRDDKGKVVGDDIYMPKTTNKYVTNDTERSFILDHRKQIITDALAGRRTITRVSLSPGEPNNTGTNKNILELLAKAGKELSGVDFAYGDLNRVPNYLNGMQDDLAHVNALELGPGNVAMVHNMTVNGQHVATKLNPTKLGKTLAQILWQAFYNSGTTEGAFQAVYKGPGVTGNITNNFIVNLLTFAGNISKERVEMGATHLANKVLAYKFNKGNPYVEYNYDLKKGDTTKIYIKNHTPEQVNEFVSFIAENKNLALDFGRLNELVPESFTIGNMKFAKGQSYLHEVLLNNFAVTDIDLYSGNSAYKSPLLQIDFGNQVEAEPVVETEREKEITLTADDVYDPGFEGSKIRYNNIVWTVERFSPIFEEDTRDYLSEAESGEQGMFEAEMAFKGGEEEVEPAVKKPSAHIELRDELGKLSVVTDLELIGNAVFISKGEKKKEGPSLDDILNSDIPFRHRTSVRNVQEKIDLNKELAWLRAKLGNVSLLQFNEIVSMAIQKGRDVMGFVYEGAIGIFEDAAPGTVYHEAFEHVFTNYLTPKQQERVIREAKERYAPEMLAHYQKDNVDNLTDKQVAHFMADRFMEYVESDGEVKPDGPQMRNWFQKILDFIKALVQFNRSEMDKLFEAIQREDFRNRADTFSREEQDNIVQNIGYLLMTENNIDKFGDIEELDFNLVKDHLSKQLEQFRAVTDPNEALQAAKLASVYERILMEWDDFVDLTHDYLGTINIQRKDGELVADDEENEVNEFERFDKAPYEISAKDNVRTEIKLLIASLPSSKERDPLTGLFRFVDFHTMWMDLINDLHDAPTDKIMLDRLSVKAKKSLPHHVLLYGGKSRLGLLNGPDELRIKFWQTMYKHKNDFTDFRYNTFNGEVVAAGMRSSFTRTQATKHLQQWGQQFVTSNLFNQATKQPDKNQASALVNKFGKFIRDVRNSYKGKSFTRGTI